MGRWRLEEHGATFRCLISYGGTTLWIIVARCGKVHILCGVCLAKTGICTAKCDTISEGRRLYFGTATIFEWIFILSHNYRFRKH